MSAPLPDIDRKRLFLGSCIALIATSVAFATVGAIMLALKREFILTNAEVGWIGGAALWGFAVSQVVFAPLCDTLGMRTLLRLSFVGHLAGTACMIGATGFGMLFAGALVIAMANGLVEAACNPLVATLYPNNKAVKLNQFHVWFPGGVVLGGVGSFVLDQVGLGAWELKLGLILIPTVVYGVLMLRASFPPTENVQAGVSTGQMFKATFATPLMWLMLFCMALTASTELGPNRWVPAVLESGLSQAAGGFVGIGVLVLAWINGLMALMRYNSDKIVGRFSPTLVLLASSVVATGGLLWLSYADTALMAFGSATVFALGVAYFWPTMLGFVNERMPRTGALGLGLMGAVGMAVVGLVTAPQMGGIADEYAHERLPEARVVDVLQTVRATYPALTADVPSGFTGDLERAITTAQKALAAHQQSGALPQGTTANALRAVVDSKAAVESTTNATAQALPDRAAGLLGPADNYGGRMSFRYIVPFTALLILIFGGLYLRDRRRGGYEVESLAATSDAS
ncbi:MFS transporter [Salisaeta longa]|uniref:MFS transporter n=1 Tax=Salisaeta longa TaxID=503170 RepID=UPI0003B39AFD|nr:MFS transporter [Salisaeta longa]